VDEKQARYLGAVQNEKTMMTFIMLLMSGVVLVVIFLIFYQIVRDKTRDIGIIKAVGGSEIGVAAIFLSYGLMIGIVGGGLGALTGTAFVTHTNQIHEWIFQMTGMIIWDRSVYLFDRIPDVVRLSDVVTYFCVALVAGWWGRLFRRFWRHWKTRCRRCAMSEATPPLLRLVNIHKSYRMGSDVVPVLRGVNLEVAEGEFVRSWGRRVRGNRRCCISQGRWTGRIRWPPRT